MALDDPITLSAKLEPLPDGRVQLELEQPLEAAGVQITRLTFADADDAIYAAGMALVTRLREVPGSW